MKISTDKMFEADYCEIGQSSKIKFTYGLSSADGKVCDILFKPIRCREFFNELVMKQLTGNDVLLYNMDTAKATPNIFSEQDKVWLMMTGLNAESFVSIFDRLQRYLPEKLETFLSTSWSGFVLPRRFYRNQLLISTLTLVIRLLEQNMDWEASLLGCGAKWDKYHNKPYYRVTTTGVQGYNESVYLSTLLRYYCSEQSVIEIIRDILLRGSDDYFGPNELFTVTYDEGNGDDHDEEEEDTNNKFSGSAYKLHETGVVSTLTRETHNKKYLDFYSKFVVKAPQCAA